MDFVQHYARAFDWVVRQCPPPDKFAHMCAGLAIWLLAAMLLRRKLSSPAPLIAVAIFELANEYMDYLHRGGMHWQDTIGDAVATLFWPAAILAALRLRPAVRG